MKFVIEMFCIFTCVTAAYQVLAPASQSNDSETILTTVSQYNGTRYTPSTINVFNTTYEAFATIFNEENVLRLSDNEEQMIESLTKEVTEDSIMVMNEQKQKLKSEKEFHNITEISKTQKEILGNLEESYEQNNYLKKEQTLPINDLSKTFSKSPSKCRMGGSIQGELPVENNFFANETCYFCYSYIPLHRKKYLLQIKQDVFVASTHEVFVKHYMVENETSYNFSPDDLEAWFRISRSLTDEVEADKLQTCCFHARSCCDQMINNSLSNSNKGCPSTWDGWSCFSQMTLENTIAQVQCPIYAYKGFPKCVKFATKRCLEGNVWESKNGHEWTDYTSCSLRRFLTSLYVWEICMHSLSIMALIPAILLIVSIKPLRIQRHLMHLNFFAALMGRSVLKIIEVSSLKLAGNYGGDIFEANGAGCKTISSLTKYFLIATWTWMFAESFYLHQLIARAFKRPASIKVFMAIGWGISAIMVIIWIICKSVLENDQCWLGDAKGQSHRLYLITDAVQIIILVANIVLLVDMARVLGTKLRGVNTDNSVATRKAVKATSFLIPMFGLQFLFTLIMPKSATTHCIGMEIFLYFATAVNGLQGLYVAVIYCYINAEVQKCTKRILFKKYPQMFGKSTMSSMSTFEPVTSVSQVQSEGSSMTEDPGVKDSFL